MMLSTGELKLAFSLAEEEGFIESDTLGDPDHDFACDSECDECPASPACAQLTENTGEYITFMENYKKLYTKENDATN